MVPYVDAVVAVAVMHVLLFLLHVCLLRECDGAGLTAMLCGGWMRCGCGECRTCGWHTRFKYCVYRSLRAIDECGAWDERSV